MKNQQPVLILPEMPFCVGACRQPTNPLPLPNTFPLELCINPNIGRLEQVKSSRLEQLLSTAYSLGIEIGTPSDDTNLGKPYVMDFVDFIHDTASPPGKVLEIGAGVGFLSRTLIDHGWDVESIEPGKGYSKHWDKYKLEVINDFFPSSLASGPYDLVIFYTVLEHIKDTCSFLRSVVSHLAPNGKVILSVPDCSIELEMGDPSMLLHEHYQYFTPKSLERTLKRAGLAANITLSEFGRSIYASGTVACDSTHCDVAEGEIQQFASFGKRVLRKRRKFQAELDALLTEGTVGIYCPGRALSFLSSRHKVRFFDDSLSLQGRYYPPFSSRIESRSDLFENPPESLFIMSRTFGPQMAEELAPLLKSTTILQLDKLLVER